MLIGLDLSDLHCSLRKIKGCPGEPIARLTPLGWTSIGPFQEDSRSVNQMSFFASEERQLDALIKQMWDIDEPQSCSLIRPEDNESEKTVLATFKQTADGCTMGLPRTSVAPPLKGL